MPNRRVEDTYASLVSEREKELQDRLTLGKRLGKREGALYGSEAEQRQQAQDEGRDPGPPSQGQQPMEAPYDEEDERIVTKEDGLTYRQIWQRQGSKWYLDSETLLDPGLHTVADEGGFQNPAIIQMGQSGYAPTDPRAMAALAELQGQLDSGQYEEELRRLSQQRLMRQQELGAQIGETTQAMGSRGQGRVAQIARASEMDLQAGYAEEIVKAKESADLAAREASKGINEIIKTSVDEYATMHGLSLDERNQHLNEANAFILAMENLRADLITGEVLSHKNPASWEEWGKFMAQAWEEWYAQTSTEGRTKVTMKYSSFTADDYNDPGMGTISAVETIKK